MQPKRVLLVLPGTLFWIFVVIAIVTEDAIVIGITIALGVGTFLGFAGMAIRKSSAEKKVKRRIWAEGTPGTAKVVKAKPNGSMNDNPYVELRLEVSVPGQPIRSVDVRQLISQVMVSRVQPDSEIAVKVDPADPTVVVVDEELTPYGY